MVKGKRVVLLDELELYLNILKANDPEEINNMTSKEIAEKIEKQFDVECSEQDIFTIHEPTIMEDILDLEIQLRNIYNYNHLENDYRTN